MNKHTFFIAGLFTFLLLSGTNGFHLFSQSKAGKCSSTLLALNMAPVKVAEARSAAKKPCDKEEKRINQSPQDTKVGSSGYYNNVTIDQLGETFINSYPGLTSGSSATAKKPCSSQLKEEQKKLTACRESLKKKQCPSKEEELAPKKLRPSATVKLASYTVEN
ncbi:hypothetical protein [Flavilitoribacter nigricans]|uniref:Uncharacterized protein n=1 Tax=Flavilitoribacter nigricans (strain ATCC 23147 / DSM 23189 / NBRC 102662 / NCIMB 1420 / SS-2) TaxID=1122177 RepID=A0A2D0N2W1_FLAN2|nr:hypothetical protein [Flavilitoribacter nigricans]PHN02851.1 hypothetical protein CRP01_30190 [Flavilitoribacter nigricans DSM 23189 = NBRC 102662]